MFKGEFVSSKFITEETLKEFIKTNIGLDSSTYIEGGELVTEVSVLLDGESIAKSTSSISLNELKDALENV